MRVTFFCFAKRKSPKKRRPPVCDPFAVRRGKPASSRLRGAPWNSLCAARAAQTATASQFTRHGRCDAHAHPATAPPQAQPAGGGQPNIHSGHRCARLGPRSAWRLRPRRRAERSDGPCGLRVFNPLLAAPAAGCLRGGMRAPARMLRELTRRVCPNGAPQARSELRGAPRKRPDAGLPRSEAQGSQTEGRLSFAYFSLAKQRKVSRPPGRDPAPALRKSTE